MLLTRSNSPHLPRALKPDVRLKEHQLDGLAWLQHLFSYSPGECRGAVLADDMGLGKTLQILTLIAWAHEQDSNLLSRFTSTWTKRPS
jgi:SNF2 family DNA or RNA helicase